MQRFSIENDSFVHMNNLQECTSNSLPNVIGVILDSKTVVAGGSVGKSGVRSGGVGVVVLGGGG